MAEDYATQIADRILAAGEPATAEQIREAIAQGARSGYALGYGQAVR